MFEKERGLCDRCGFSNNNIQIMSKFNKDMICMPCKEEEKAHPKYQEASEAELNECKAGRMNYIGIGLPEDLHKKYSK